MTEAKGKFVEEKVVEISIISGFSSTHGTCVQHVEGHVHTFRPDDEFNHWFFQNIHHKCCHDNPQPYYM